VPQTANQLPSIGGDNKFRKHTPFDDPECLAGQRQVAPSPPICLRICMVLYGSLEANKLEERVNSVRHACCAGGVVCYTAIPFGEQSFIADAIENHKLQGLKYFRLIDTMLGRLRSVGTARDKSGNSGSQGMAITGTIGVGGATKRQNVCSCRHTLSMSSGFARILFATRFFSGRFLHGVFSLLLGGLVRNVPIGFQPAGTLSDIMHTIK
jgi:hypothetical protein